MVHASCARALARKYRPAVCQKLSLGLSIMANHARAILIDVSQLMSHLQHTPSKKWFGGVF
jgi:hypothetical protein